MIRYYYTAPDAARMSKHFGMKFAFRTDYGVVFIYEVRREDGGKLNYSSFFDVGYEHEVYEAEGKHYIHPDSEALLTPQSGDLLQVDLTRNKSFGYPFVFCQFTETIDNIQLIRVTIEPFGMDDDDLSEVYIGQLDVKQIIQRNGIPFMWPHTEEIA